MAIEGLIFVSVGWFVFLLFSSEMILQVQMVLVVIRAEEIV